MFDVAVSLYRIAQKTGREEGRGIKGTARKKGTNDLNVHTYQILYGRKLENLFLTGVSVRTGTESVRSGTYSVPKILSILGTGTKVQGNLERKPLAV